MIDSVDPAFDEALAWAARIQDAAFDDWDGHATWLSSDAGNPARYHRAALAMQAGLVAVLAKVEEPTSPTNDNYTGGDPRIANGARRRWKWPTAAGAGIGLAACIVALVSVPRSTQQPTATYSSAPGEVRHFRLPDGTTMALNGDTVLRFDRGNRRTAILDRGQAYLDVVHDEAHPFELQVGGRTFRDVGTAFDVRRNGDDILLSVAEGAVAFDPQDANIRISAGRSIAIHGTTVVLHEAPVAAVGGWRSGRLVFQDAPLADVAGELSQSLGEPVILAPGLGERRFSGILRLERDHTDTVDQLVHILGLKSRRSANGWLITA